MIPVNQPLFSGREKEYLDQCIDQGWVSSDGPFVTRFEEEFSAYLGLKYGVAVCNGTAALEVAVAAAGIGPGDEVIMPTFTIISCALAVVRMGARPVLVDSEPETWNMDVSQVESRITGRTKAIMPVHIYGHPVDMDPVMALAEKHNLTVIEDAAEVHGALYKGKKAGSFGQVSCFSFYANKIVTSGEGGMVVTSDGAIAARARGYRNLCFKPERRFYHTELGHNFRMTNLQAAVAVAQLERIDNHIQIKRRNAAAYGQGLADIDVIKLPAEKEWARNVYWMYGIELKDEAGMDNDDLAARLQERGVGTRPFFLGMHEQPVFHRMGLFQGERYPVAERLARKGLYLPSGLALTQGQIEAVCRALHDIFARQ
ncbi:MAG: DegT/DnrJ/EryC1/StrS family aminotransferase [Chloroflexi bacterium]|nr:DegT/DnrJ/EryC1/StrS family aminotransferase [Chloroflexota bacterium]